MRPEHTAPADAFYNKGETTKYAGSSRMATTQRHLAERCLHHLAIPPGRLVLDIGCGSGYSGSVLERNGHTWIGLDVSTEMLRAARAPHRRRDVVEMDIGSRLNCRRYVW